MRAVVQRVSHASVLVDGAMVGRCGPGLLLLVGVHKLDTEANAQKLAHRIAHLRVFNDESGRMNLSLLDLQLAALAVSNFTVYGETAKNRRPSFIDSAGFEVGMKLFEAFVSDLRGIGVPVETGQFGAHMQVQLANDGPVTVIVEG